MLDLAVVAQRRDARRLDDRRARVLAVPRHRHLHERLVQRPGVLSVDRRVPQRLR